MGEEEEDFTPEEELTPRGRRRVFRIICYLSYADDVVDLSERDLIEDFRCRLGISAEEATELEAEAKQGKKLQIRDRYEEAVYAVEALAAMFVVDGVLHPDEASRLKRIAKALEVPQKILAKIVRNAMIERGQAKHLEDESS